MAVQKNTKQAQQENIISLKDLFFLCLSHWKWFVISLAVTLGIAFYYLLTTPPVYTRWASIVIKEGNSSSSMSDISGVMGDVDIFQSNANVNNELISFQSPAVMLDVVKRLHLDVNYLCDGRFYKRVLYGRTLPYSVHFCDLQDNDFASLTLRQRKDRSVELSEFTFNGEEIGDKTITAAPGDSVSTPVGTIVVSEAQGYSPEFLDPIYVSRYGLNASTGAYSGRLSVVLDNEDATVIDLIVNDVCIQRAEEVINTVIGVYNENWVKDKNQIAVSTSMFINERLGVIESELGNVDSDISSYKSANLLPDVQAASNMYMTQSTATDKEIMELNTQLSMARYVRNHVTTKSNDNQLLPVNSGLENSNIERQISEYNALQLKRNSLVANSSEQNPLAVDMDKSLQAMRDAIITSIDNHVVTLNTSLNSLERSEQKTTARLAANPTQAKYLLSVERQQKVKEALYLFLLQKREENELSQAFTAYNTRVITPPTGSLAPTAPVHRNIWLVALAIGLLIPIVVIFVIESMNSAVRGRKDLESLTIPFVGEIPLSYHRKKNRFAWLKLKRKAAVADEPDVVVKEKSRNVINEAFRVVRTNLEFMAGSVDGCKVIMLSSANSGSGKTFICMNLATSFAIKGKRVIAIDLDMRKASLSAYVNSPKRGVSDYLNGQVSSLSDIKVKSSASSQLDIIPVGTTPPNPTELLFSERLQEMLEELRRDYDYVFIDCPPAEVVADATIINKLADLTLFIIRAGLLDRSELPEIEKYYTDHKLRNMALVLNGTSNAHTRYGYHKYGYKYGYKYGGYAEED